MADIFLILLPLIMMNQTKPMPKTGLSSILRRRIYLMGKQMMGSRFYAHLKEMQGLQFASDIENREIQRKLLSYLLDKAFKQVPFYQHRFHEAGLIKSDGTINLARFCDLPPLTREDIQTCSQSLLNVDKATRKRIFQMPTGGTTGNPVAPYGDLRYWDWCLAHTWLFYGWMGLRIGMPYFYFWGAPQDFGSQGADWKSLIWMNGIQNRHVLNCRVLSDELMERYLWEINRMPNHQYMVSYVHELYEFASFIQLHHLKVTRPMKGILVTTAAISENMRATIETVFQCPTYSRYGCREVGDVACECHYKLGLHINPLYSFVEVVDDKGHHLPPGEEGRILITNFHNELMPLIRYEVQDTGVLIPPRPCRCGRNWPTFKQITGRIHEQLLLPDGSRFGKVFLNYITECLPQLKAYQIHQTALDRVEFHLLSSVPNYLQVYEDAIIESHRRFMNSTQRLLAITYHQVEDLEKAPSGKRLIVLNKISSAQESMAIENV